MPDNVTKEVSFTFRVDQALKDEFHEVARSQDLSASQLLRKFMRDFIQENKKVEGYDVWLDAQIKESKAAFERGDYLTKDEMISFIKGLRSK